jgi:hypothetical protein
VTTVHLVTLLFQRKSSVAWMSIERPLHRWNPRQTSTMPPSIVTKFPGEMRTCCRWLPSMSRDHQISGAKDYRYVPAAGGHGRVSPGSSVWVTTSTEPLIPARLQAGPRTQQHATGRRSSSEDVCGSSRLNTAAPGARSRLRTIAASSRLVATVDAAEQITSAVCFADKVVGEASQKV